MGDRWRELRAGFRAADADIKQALYAGLRLGILGRPQVQPDRLSAGTFWAMALFGVAISGGLAWLAVEPPRAFSIYGVHAAGYATLAGLLGCFVVTRYFGQTERLWPLATLVFAGSLVPSVVTLLVYDHLLARLPRSGMHAYNLAMLLSLAWFIGVWRNAMTVLDIGPTARSRASLAASIVVLLAVVSYSTGAARIWHKDYAAQYESEQANREPSLVAEEVFDRQARLLDGALAALAPQTPGKPDLYFVAFGGDGSQDVFLKETLYSAELFETRLGARSRALRLANNRRKLEELPLATVTNLERALGWLGTHMDPAQDILFLFLTSHGSRDAELTVRLQDLTFRPLTADTLASLIERSGIQWKVLVLSGCYTGSFIDRLKDDRTLLITAARADRTSFGCSDDADLTYFGRAYFQDALQQTTSFVEAFAIASRHVAAAEKREGYAQSEPQMVEGKLIGAKLQEWAAGLAAAP